MRTTRTIVGILALALLSACGDRDLMAPELAPPHRDLLSCGYLGSNNCPERTPQASLTGVRKPESPPSPPQAHPRPN